MKKQTTDFADLKAILLNCSIKTDKTQSHTQRLLNRVAGIMQSEGVQVTQEYILDYNIAFGMIKDGKETGQKDDWPKIQKKIMAADILIIGSPI
jgi:multimeric flavodoxin WrbA